MPRAYLSALWKHWWALMSCAAFTLATVVIAGVRDQWKWTIGTSAVLAVLFFLIASYRAWREEHQKLEREIELNGKPEVRGSFSNVQFANGGRGYVFDLYLCNHRQSITNIEAVLVTLAEDEHRQQVVRAVTNPEARTLRLERGIGQNILASVKYEDAMFVMKITLSVIDGFGNKYRIPYRGPQPMNIEVERDDRIADIYKATWGVGSVWDRNVTQQLQGYFAFGVEVLASNQFFSDHKPGRDKYLRVYASLDKGRTKKWYTFKENQPVLFPSAVEEI